MSLVRTINAYQYTEGPGRRASVLREVGDRGIVRGGLISVKH